MAKGDDKPAEPSKKLKRNQARLFRVGHTFELETDREAALFSTLAADVQASRDQQAARVRGGKGRAELNTRRDRQFREWAEEIRSRHPDWSETSVAKHISRHLVPEMSKSFRRDAIECANGEQYSVAADIDRSRIRWNVSVRRIREIISRT